MGMTFQALGEQGQVGVGQKWNDEIQYERREE